MIVEGIPGKNVGAGANWNLQQELSQQSIAQPDTTTMPAQSSPESFLESLESNI
jgi:hypothetical protein